MIKTFTLAEVLITLVVIGVVAALTVPSIVNKYRNEKTISELKKVYSTLNQAFMKAQVDNGNVLTWEEWDNDTETILRKYISPQLMVKKVYPKQSSYHKIMHTILG